MWARAPPPRRIVARRASGNGEEGGARWVQGRTGGGRGRRGSRVVEAVNPSSVAVSSPSRSPNRGAAGVDTRPTQQSRPGPPRSPNLPSKAGKARKGQGPKSQPAAMGGGGRRAGKGGVERERGAGERGWQRGAGEVGAPGDGLGRCRGRQRNRHRSTCQTLGPCALTTARLGIIAE